VIFRKIISGKFFVEKGVERIGSTVDGGRKLTDSVKRLLLKIRIYEPLQICSHYILRGHMIRRIRIQKYLRNNPEPKLQVGCGPNSLEGWLNADLIYGDIYVNATKKLPFGDNTLNFVFCEHLIEHFSKKEGFRLLKESYRVLKIGGIIRITTPDLQKLIRLYFDTNQFAKREDCIRVIYGSEARLSTCEYFNNYMHRWGHKFIYDEQFIRTVLTQIGYANLTFCNNKESKHKALLNLEKHFEKYPWLNQAETLIVEAEKR
jgi:predicted SAM-dependent methyltransferase